MEAKDGINVGGLRGKSDSGDNVNNQLEVISQILNKARDYVILIVTFFFYKFFRLMIVTFQKFTWAVTGIENIRRDAKRGLQFKQSAHVLTIKRRRKFINMDLADPVNFVTVHDCFKHPNYVLKSNVSLYCMTKSEAVFVETPENMNIFRTVDEPMFISQFKHAEKMILMPLPSFHKIASDIGDPRLPVALLSSTGKCGSSLLCQTFANIPGMLVLRDPDVLTTLGMLYKAKVFRDGEYQQLLASAIRLLCKPDSQSGMILIKPRACCTAMLEDIWRTFPRIYQLFMYRNSLKSVSSSLTMFQTEPMLQAVRFLADNKITATIFPFVRTILYNYFCSLLDKSTPTLKPHSLSTVGIFTLAWAAAVGRCISCKEKGLPLLTFLYEDFMINPRRSCHLLFEYLDIPQKYLDIVVNSFRADSATMRKVSVRPKSSALFNVDTRKSIPTELKHEADMVLKKFHLPKLGEKFEINGLVSFD